MSINGGTAGSDFMCAPGGFGECGEAAGESATIYWVPTVYRAVNSHDPPEIGVE